MSSRSSALAQDLSTRHAYAVDGLGAGNSLLLGYTWVPVFRGYFIRPKTPSRP